MKRLIENPPELVDGIWPNTGTYIQCSISYEWLTEEAFDGDKDTDDLIRPLDLVDLIECRLESGVCELSIPTRKIATRTISALRRYADYMEREFVNGPRACDAEDET